MAISTKFGASQEYFGTEDYRQARKQGKTASEVLDFITANFEKFSPGKRNQPGGGGLYDQIFSDYRKEISDTLAKQSEGEDFSQALKDQALYFQTLLDDQQQQAEAARKQLLINLQQGNRAPAEVRFAAPKTQTTGLVGRGTTGYFGRQGMRIGSLNVPSMGRGMSSGLNIGNRTSSFA